MVRYKNFPSSRFDINTHPRVQGEFGFLGDKKLYVRGTTYGTFRPAEGGSEYELAVVERVLVQMMAKGFSAVGTYTVLLPRCCVTGVGAPSPLLRTKKMM
jgi:hypothetical protein